MINAYSLAAEVLYGDMDKTYPIINQSEMKLRDKTMKLSEKTLTLLKNFSNINQSILFKQGSSLRTISVMKNILAEATIDEDLPTDFGKNGVVKILVREKKNDTSNVFAITVGETDESFEFNFKVENIKILPGTYDVVVSKKLLSRFTCQNYNLKYYIALEPDSTFE